MGGGGGGGVGDGMWWRQNVCYYWYIYLDSYAINERTEILYCTNEIGDVMQLLCLKTCCCFLNFDLFVCLFLLDNACIFEHYFFFFFFFFLGGGGGVSTSLYGAEPYAIQTIQRKFPRV